MEEIVPNEFAAFVRHTAMRAFDHLAGEVNLVDPSLRKLLRNWLRLGEDEKAALLDQLIAAAWTTSDLDLCEPAAEPPSREIRRYDPEEVARTLPRKPQRGARRSKQDGSPAT